MSQNKLPAHILKALAEKLHKGSLVKLNPPTGKIDFYSNDYLGFSTQGILSSKINSHSGTEIKIGATGSRLVSGNSEIFEETEKQIALFHHAESALLFNSGYQAVLGLLSCVPQKTDLVLYDEYSHASLIDGIRLGTATHYKYRHRDTESVNDLIQHHYKNFENIFIVTESVFSFDGDTAPLLDLVELGQSDKNIFLIVDEAHGIGVFGKQGRGLCNALNVEQNIFARIYTYGKALGCSGASVAGNQALKNYLVNFSHPFVYSTAMNIPNVDAIKNAYQLLIDTEYKDVLQNNISYFYSHTSGIKNMIKSQSAIQTLLLNDIQTMNDLCVELNENNLQGRMIKSPSNKQSAERMRFYIHAFNTREEIDKLIGVIEKFKSV